MARYIHDLADWPQFRWRDKALGSTLAAVRHHQGRLIGRMESLGLPLRAEAVLQSLTEETVKSNEIEGEVLNRDQVRSSIARRLGMDVGALVPADRHVDGVVEMVLDATQNYTAPLTTARLFDWHAALFPTALFPTGHAGLAKIRVAAWRDDASGPMQVVSGPVGRARVHYEAPGATRVDGEMRAFLAWFNAPDAVDPVLRAALAHLWFVTIHPFDDGNGRIARAIADMQLARSEASRQRFYSMSAQIRIERAAYYSILEATQKGEMDITAWLLWFIGCLDRAFAGADIILATVLATSRFWARHAGVALHNRQRLVVNRLLDGFEGRLTSSKYAKLAKCSQDTALRDIEGLMAYGMLARDAAGGRSTGYVLVTIDV